MDHISHSSSQSFYIYFSLCGKFFIELILFAFHSLFSFMPMFYSCICCIQTLADAIALEIVQWNSSYSVSKGMERDEKCVKGRKQAVNRKGNWNSQNSDNNEKWKEKQNHKNGKDELKPIPLPIVSTCKCSVTGSVIALMRIFILFSIFKCFCCI